MAPAIAFVLGALVLIGVVVLVTEDAHSWYTGPKSPRGGSCCGGHDCRLLTAEEIRLTEAGEIEVLALGSWWPALDGRWYVGPSPDGSWSLCIAPRDRLPRCVFGGLGT
jgi:hypothetical protein